jgi:hypothetical protein
MTRREIIVPKLHDSFSNLTINGENRLFRFTYNDTFDCWTFGVYNTDRSPILQGVKIVPKFPLNLYFPKSELSGVYFFAESHFEKIGRSDFWDENAHFFVEET